MRKKIILSFFVTIISFFSLSFGQGNQNPGFEIVPPNSSNVGSIVNNVGVGGKVIEKYKDAAYGQETVKDGKRVRVGSNMSVGDQFASGIMTRDTILDYAVYLVKFLGQLALLAGAIMIIFYGYKKATEHFKFNGTLGKVVIGILVISFAYVIIKLIWSAFIS